MNFKIYKQACNLCDKYADQFMFKDTINHFSLKFSEKILKFII